jgi:hypothetical protein
MCRFKREGRSKAFPQTEHGRRERSLPLVRRMGRTPPGGGGADEVGDETGGASGAAAGATGMTTTLPRG